MRIGFLGAVLLTACSSSPAITSALTELNFSSAKSIILNVSSEREALAKLGQPTKKVSSKETEKWIYNDVQTNYQRLTLTFDDQGTLESVLWIPLPGEQENKLANVKAQIPGLKPIKTEEKSIDNL